MDALFLFCWCFFFFFKSWKNVTLRKALYVFVCVCGGGGSLRKLPPLFFSYVYTELCFHVLTSVCFPYFF